MHIILAIKTQLTIYISSYILAYQDNKICETNDCHNAAAEIKNGLDMSADPCQDFDKFACGGWRSRNPIPKSQSQWTQFKKLWQHEETLLRDVIERQANSSGRLHGYLIFMLYYCIAFCTIYNNYCIVYSKAYSLMIFLPTIILPIHAI
jgi:hypothetical protein